MADAYIDTPQGLRDLCGELKGSPWLALDTEFIRDKTYYPRLCLLQVANPTTVACIDPLALPDLSPLLTLLGEPDTIKILHAGRQDLEILYQLTGQVPGPVFDTQVAASLLGLGDQLGYAALVATMLGVSLDKSHTRTDWAQRPLEAAQLHYAWDDVRYLGPIYLQQHARLEQMRRLGWLEAEFAAMVDETAYHEPAEELWRRVKGANLLKGRQLAVLRALAAWREQIARRDDRPRRWVLRDEILVELARRSPKKMAELGRIRGLDNAAHQAHGAALLEIIAAAYDEPQASWPRLELRPRLSPHQEALVDAAMALVRLRCLEQDISPSCLTSRREVEQLVAGRRDLPLLGGWRRAIAGGDLLQFMEGRLTLRVHGGEPMLQQQSD